MKITVKSVERSSIITVRLCIEGENGCVDNKSFVFFSELLQFGYFEGDEVDCAVYDEVEDASLVTEAIKKGLTVLSFGANSETMLVAKLRRRRVRPDHAKKAAEYLKRHGYVNEGGDAEREAERCLRKHWGMIRIIAHLKSKGYDEQTLSDVENSLSAEDFAEHCAKLILQNYPELPSDPKEKRRMVSSLIRYGYTMSEIDAAVRKILKKDLDQ